MVRCVGCGCGKNIERKETEFQKNVGCRESAILYHVTDFEEILFG
jgi:hypothetical protein